MQQKRERRRATRIVLSAPTVVEAVGSAKAKLHENLARVYERVEPNRDVIGKTFPGAVRDLSTNGAFIAGEALPLLSRVSFAFQIEGYGKVEVIGWTLWRRHEDCEIPRPDGSPARLPKGIGVLFEAVPLAARLAIHKLVTTIDRRS